MGVWFVSPYHEQGGSGTATAEDFTVARKYMTLRSHLTTKYNAAIDAIEANTLADLAAAAAQHARHRHHWHLYRAAHGTWS